MATAKKILTKAETVSLFLRKGLPGLANRFADDIKIGKKNYLDEWPPWRAIAWDSFLNALREDDEITPSQRVRWNRFPVQNGGSILRIVRAYTRTFSDTGQVTAYVEWIGSKGDQGRTEGSPNGSHMTALFARAKREGVPITKERW